MQQELAGLGVETGEQIDGMEQVKKKSLYDDLNHGIATMDQSLYRELSSGPHFISVQNKLQVKKRKKLQIKPQKQNKIKLVFVKSCVSGDWWQEFLDLEKKKQKQRINRSDYIYV